MDKRNALWLAIRVAGLVLIVTGVIILPDVLTGLTAALMITLFLVIFAARS